MIIPGPVPVYIQLANLLRERIESGDLAAGTPVPSKRALRAEHGVSGETVDKAIGLLKADGMVRTVTGLGIFVQPRDRWTAP
jgi:DNA-binding GntR family transcriptional regulator